MLKALELTGFKSFADRTRFVFPDGITVVVGPNGSGKSNIVDAIKWVLGAQSAKSLRGADMADVIFKGSAAGGRKPANSAEATLVFDNASGVLGVESPEVQITRRVYRSGESEYLINRNPCRLKDIKDLFRGTGVGVDAYSLIEQGKVDRMLQASPKDRRAIFEEAAGISRFKVKRTEALRRLERAQQDLTRLKDIVDEVHHRYETLRLQAEKAQRYREMVQRLHLLRCQMGLKEQDQWLSKIADQSRKLEQLTQEQSQALSDLESAKSESQKLELQLQTLADEAQQAHDMQNSYKHDIALLTGQIEQLEHSLKELKEAESLLMDRLHALRQRAVLTAEESKAQQQVLDHLSEQFQRESELIAQLQTQRDAMERQRVATLQAVETNRLEHASCMRHAMEVEQQQKQLSHRMDEWNAQMESLRAQRSEKSQVRELHLVELQDLQAKQHELERERIEAHATWQRRLEELEADRHELRKLQTEAIQLQGKRETACERLQLLQHWEQQLEGVGLGARQILALSRQHQSSPWDSVLGLVADLIEIDMTLAPLIDVALGDAAETVILSDGRLIECLTEGAIQIEGRVSLLRLDRLSARKSGDKIQLDGLRGVLGRADRLVRFQPDFEPLIRFLLGTTWLVDSLPTALDLSHLRGAGLKFVTTSCERIDSDGTLTFGTLHSSVGIVSRRSELHSTAEEIKHMDRAIQEQAEAAVRLQQRVLASENDVAEQDARARDMARKHLEGSVQLQLAEKRLDEMQLQIDTMVQEESELLDHMAAAETQARALTQILSQVNERAASLHQKLNDSIERSNSMEEDWKSINDQLTAQRIDLARLEQRMENVRVTVEQLSRDHTERHIAVEDTQMQIQSNLQKQQRAEQAIIEAQERIAAIQISLATNHEQLLVLAGNIQEIRLVRQQTQKQADSLQRQYDRCRDRYVQLESELRFSEATLEQLRARFLDDYQIPLVDEQLQAGTPPLEPGLDAEALANQLKLEISQVGDVNMEALRELDELQQRYETLKKHYDDLCTSRDDIQKIISKIDQDSRRIFDETLEAIRVNFQQLYRKSFGGGSADLVLEEGEDELECGVEIVATPPGKTAFSNSLLSGGEKALTAVALIMAIFQFRPSPFCVLDEVDAPFDEANIGRFVSVLKEFLHTTKFIVVTHSKKTMTAADTLYGVTMQENGVSKQVSVRFEDVGEDGEILSENSGTKRTRAA